MVSITEDALQGLICFDIVDVQVVDGHKILTETLTAEEKEEMYAIVSELEGTNSHELIDFTLQENTPTAGHHPGIKLSQRKNWTI